MGRIALIHTARVIRCVPPHWLPAIGSSIGDFVRIVSIIHRRRVMDNLEIAFGGEKSPAELRRIVREFYRNLGMNLLEFLRMPVMTPAEIDARVRLIGTEHLDAGLYRGRGVILLTAHLGNWELVGAKLALAGYPVNVIARDQADEQTAQLFRHVRESCGLRVIPSRTAVRASLECLRRNEILCILGDINAGRSGVFVDFFGKLASTVAGPAALALRTGAVVVPAFCTREPDHRHSARACEPLTLDSSGDRDNDIIRHTAALTKLIEAQIRREPEQWFWLHRRWKTRPPWEVGNGPVAHWRARVAHRPEQGQSCSKASSAS